MSGLRVAVLGCGSIGKRHAENLRRSGRDVIAFDPVASTRESCERELGVDALPSLADVWERKPDAVLVAAPSDRHVALAHEALARGCHVFVEKPLSHSMEGVRDLCASAERSPLVTMVACNMRFHPGPATVRRLVAEGAVGAPLAARFETGSYLPRWRPSQDYRRSYSASSESGGAVLDCIHEIDLALWMFGEATVVGRATASAACLGLETDGLAEAILRHGSGVLTSLHLNFVQRDYHRACRVIGELGTIAWDWNATSVKVVGPDGEPARELARPDSWQTNDMYEDELAHFLDSVERGRPAMNPIADAARTLAVALEIRGGAAA